MLANDNEKNRPAMRVVATAFLFPLLCEYKGGKSGIPQCLPSNDIINSILIRDLAFGMGFLGMNAELLSRSPLLT